MDTKAISSKKSKLISQEAESDNIYSELELNELQLLQVKYGHESGAL